MGHTNDFDECSNRLQFDLFSIMVNFSCELGQIMTIYVHDDDWRSCDVICSEEYRPKVMLKRSKWE